MHRIVPFDTGWAGELAVQVKAVRWMLYAAAGVAALLLMTVVVGALLPRTFTVTRTATYGRPPAEVWKVITNHTATPSWRPGVKSVERGPDLDGKPAWHETFRNDMRLVLVTEESVPGKRLVRRITGDGLPFTGRWIFDLSPAGAGTRIALTEEGDVPNPFFRFVSKVVMGHVRHVDKYLLDLGRKFGERVRPATPD